jgi:hypothetical protein
MSLGLSGEFSCQLSEPFSIFGRNSWTEGQSTRQHKLKKRTHFYVLSGSRTHDTSFRATKATLNCAPIVSNDNKRMPWKRFAWLYRLTTVLQGWWRSCYTFLSYEIEGVYINRQMGDNNRFLCPLLQPMVFQLPPTMKVYIKVAGNLKDQNHLFPPN